MPTDEELLAMVQRQLPKVATMRPPTCRPSWPLVVLSGPESTGKTWQAVSLSADDRVGPMFYVPFGEVNVDEYGLLPGARFQIIEGDGSFRALHGIVQTLVKVPVDLARPPVIVLDSASVFWSLLSNEADAAARKDRPVDQEITITADKWNVAKRKWKSIVDPLLQWPGLVILTARADDKLAMDDEGRPMKDHRNRVIKQYNLEAHRTLKSDATVIVRLTAPGQATVTKVKSAVLTIPPDGLELPDFTLSELLFGGLQLGGANMAARTFTPEKLEGVGDAVSEAEAKRALLEALGGDMGRAKAAWQRAGLPVIAGTIDRTLVEGLIEYEQERAAGDAAAAANVSGPDAGTAERSEPVPAVAGQQEPAGDVEPVQEPPAQGDDQEPPTPQEPAAADDQEPPTPQEPAAADDPEPQRPAQDPQPVAAAPAPAPAPAQPEPPASAPQDQLQAFLGTVQASAGNMGQLRALRSKVSSLPPPMRKAASEAVTAAMAACQPAPANA